MIRKSISIKLIFTFQTQAAGDKIACLIIDEKLMCSFVLSSLLVLGEQPFTPIKDLPGSSCSSVVCLPAGLESIGQGSELSSQLSEIVQQCSPPQVLHGLVQCD